MLYIREFIIPLGEIQKFTMFCEAMGVSRELEIGYVKKTGESSADGCFIATIGFKSSSDETAMEKFTKFHNVLVLFFVGVKLISHS